MYHSVYANINYSILGYLKDITEFWIKIVLASVNVMMLFEFVAQSGLHK